MSAVMQRSEPEAQGVESEAILAFLDAVEAEHLNLHSLMLVRHGHVIAEGWWRPYAPECRRYLYSLSKSFTSTAVGFAVAEGLLRVDDRVVSFFPEDLPPVVSDNLAAMRVVHLLTMSTGHTMDTLMALLNPDAENWVRAILALPVELPPGTHFLYNSGASYLLSAIVQKVSGQTVLDYLTPRLFEPLGIVGATWDVCPRGINTGGWGLSLKTEDIARFGPLYAQKGVWNGQRLLPPEWVQAATSAQVRNDGPGRENEPVDWRQGYGYQFWRCQHGAYRADGAFGQFCVVMPAQDAVIVITSETGNMQRVLDLVWEHLLPAMKLAPLPPRPATQERLRERLSSLALPLPPAQPLPPRARDLSGRRFRVEPNDLAVRSVAFSFEDDSCVFRLWDGRTEHRIVCGNGAWVRNEAILPIMRPSLMHLISSTRREALVQVAAHSTWQDAQTLVMTWRYLETPHADTVTCRFVGDVVEMEVASSMADPNNPLLAGLRASLTGTLELEG